MPEMRSTDRIFGQSERQNRRAGTGGRTELSRQDHPLRQVQNHDRHHRKTEGGKGLCGDTDCKRGIK